MDLAYAEIISKIGGSQALTIITQASEAHAEPTVRTPMPSLPITPEESFSCLSPPRYTLPTQGPENEPYHVLEEAPVSHHFYNSKFEANDQQRLVEVKSLLKIQS